jgi:glycosyltransferase involved in cell wall biosynthesis
VLARAPDVEFVLVGDGPLRPKLEEQARSLGIEASVRFLGLRSDVADILRDSDVFVRPSLTEGMSLTVLEAMACGLPVVVTPVGGTSEVVTDGANGCLVAPGDVSALSAALLKLADDARLRRRLGRNGRALVERQYGWSRVIDANLRVYESALAAPGPVPLARAA